MIGELTVNGIYKITALVLLFPRDVLVIFCSIRIP